ncbi:hypothetical protein [Salinispora arenicola]|uniref:hypothetical protein n=1 Tax=Salinispora arenicola TaxID=168697 RepID=UPI0027DB7AD3|nr:hypothetical protein [Salinispora arenicola]
MYRIRSLLRSGSPLMVMQAGAFEVDEEVVAAGSGCDGDEDRQGRQGVFDVGKGGRGRQHPVHRGAACLEGWGRGGVDVGEHEVDLASGEPGSGEVGQVVGVVIAEPAASVRSAWSMPVDVDRLGSVSDTPFDGGVGRGDSAAGPAVLAFHDVGVASDEPGGVRQGGRRPPALR